MFFLDLQRERVILNWFVLYVAARVERFECSPVCPQTTSDFAQFFFFGPPTKAAVWFYVSPSTHWIVRKVTDSSQVTSRVGAGNVEKKLSDKGRRPLSLNFFPTLPIFRQKNDPRGSFFWRNGSFRDVTLSN